MRDLLAEIEEPQEQIPMMAGRDLFAEMEEPTLELPRPRPQMVAPEREGHWEGWIKPTLKDIGRRAILGTAETAMSLASGMLLYIPSKIYGTLALSFGEDVARMAEEDMASLGYEPYTEEARQAVEKVAKMFEVGLWPAKKAGEELKNLGFPRAGYMLQFGGELATFGVAGLAARKVRAKIKERPIRLPKELIEKYGKEKARKIVIEERLGKAERPLKELVREEEKIKPREPIKGAPPIMPKEEAVRITPRPKFFEFERAKERPTAVKKEVVEKPRDLIKEIEEVKLKPTEKPKIVPTIEEKVKEIAEVKPIPKLEPKEVKEPIQPKGKLVILKDKKKLLADIDKAIEEAPESIVDLPKGYPNKVDFDLDGGAHILNDKIALQEFRRRIAKTAEHRPVKVTLPSYPKLPKPTGKLPPEAVVIPEKGINLETFGTQKVYERATEWIKDVKEGRELKVREAVNKAREEFLEPIEGSPLDKGAVQYLKSEKFTDYTKAMPAIGELRPSEIFKYDPTAKEMIADYLTKDGKLKPAIRQSGYHAVKDFADAFDGAKDISPRSASISDPTLMIQEIDQGRWGGMAQKHILWPSRMNTLAKLKWADVQKARLSTIVETHNITSGKKANKVGDLIEYIDNESLNIPTDTLLKNPIISGVLKGYKQKTKIEFIDAAKDLRNYSNELLNAQNVARGLRKQREIPYRLFYRPWIIERNIFNRFLGLKQMPKEIMEAPQMPDFIFPDKPPNPRALARSGLLAKYPKERNIIRLMGDYIDTAARDIFDTNTVHTNKIHSTILKSKGLENAAEGINRWTAEVFAGVKPRLTKWTIEHIPSALHKTVLKIRRNLTRAVFPGNWTWNLIIQPSSAVLTLVRYGVKSNLAGLKYLTSLKTHRMVKQNAYSHIIKSRWGGKTHYQDVQNSILKNRRLEARPIEKAEDFANFLTSAMESGLTGHAVQAAYHHGKTKFGLKGRELWEYASEGGAKTQSMYNFGDLPGFLRAREVGAVGPFQTFSFTVFNTVREMNIPVVRRIVGKTGLYETLSASSVTGKTLISNRLKMLARFIAGIVVVNAVGEKAIGRKPWDFPSSFVPFIGYLIGSPTARGPHNQPVPVQYYDDIKTGIRDVIVYGSFRRLRKWFIRYHILAGTQIERMIEGVEAVAQGGVEDIRGRQLFPVREPIEQLKAIAMGPYRTEAGKEYILKRKGEGILEKRKEEKKKLLRPTYRKLKTLKGL